MGPLFVLADIPIIQVGHKTYEDILIRGGLCPSATNSANFVRLINEVKQETLSEEQRKLVFKNLGIKGDWFDRLKQALK